ncbi:MAG: class I SAM-dependent rRNA methyltransferase [Anaerolineae bacterium]|nr:class I SAM-dependent rRNA methyltransferase [Anaerolineae bacterium]
MGRIVLKAGRERSLEKRHPWIFSGAIARIEGNPENGSTLDVVDHEGRWLAKAAYSRTSKIQGRVWTWDASEPVDEAFLANRVRAALSARSRLVPDHLTNALRLVHGESDGIPGLVVDRYGDHLVMQVLSAGIENWKEVLAAVLAEQTGCAGIYERSDVDVRELEGLPQRTGLVLGMDTDTIVIHEQGLQFQVNFHGGQKTGFYVDQRNNRQILREMMPDGAAVLNCFCYTGAFTVYAFAGGAAQVTSIDSSEEALRAARINMALNQMGDRDQEWICGDVFQELRKCRDARKTYDVIILDPPKFAPTSAQAERAARGYKDINLLAFKLLRPGGLLFTFSCSGGVNTELFQKIVAGAALDAGVDAQIIAHMAQGPDHPVSLAFPEGTYLKGLVCRAPGAFGV